MLGVWFWKFNDSALRKQTKSNKNDEKAFLQIEIRYFFYVAFLKVRSFAFSYENALHFIQLFCNKFACAEKRDKTIEAKKTQKCENNESLFIC